MTLPPQAPLKLLTQQFKQKQQDDAARLAGAVAGARAGGQAAQQAAQPLLPQAGNGGMGHLPLPQPLPGAAPSPGSGPMPLAGMSGLLAGPASPLAAPPALPPMPGVPPFGSVPPAAPPPMQAPQTFAAGGMVYPAHGMNITLRPSLLGSNGEELPDGVVSGPDIVRAFLAMKAAQAQGRPLPRVSVLEHDDTDTGGAYPALHDYLSAQTDAHPDEVVRDLAAAWRNNPSRRAQIAELIQAMQAGGDNLHPDLATALGG